MEGKGANITEARHLSKGPCAKLVQTSVWPSANHDLITLNEPIREWNLRQLDPKAGAGGLRPRNSVFLFLIFVWSLFHNTTQSLSRLTAYPDRHLQCQTLSYAIYHVSNYVKCSSDYLAILMVWRWSSWWTPQTNIRTRISNGTSSRWGNFDGWSTNFCH